MAKISKDENGKIVLTADEEELKKIKGKGVSSLEDDDLDGVSGGAGFVIKSDGGNYMYTCSKCGCDDFDLLEIEYLSQRTHKPQPTNCILIQCCQCGCEACLAWK